MANVSTMSILIQKLQLQEKIVNDTKKCFTILSSFIGTLGIAYTQTWASVTDP